MKKFLLFGLIWLNCNVAISATRYYLPQTGAAAVSPTFDAGWNETTSADRIKLVSTKISSTLTDKTGVPANGFKLLYRQYVSDPIGVVNFNTTTFSLVVRTKVTTGTDTLYVSVRLYHSGGTFATLKTLAFYDTSFSTTAQTRIINSTTLANVTSTSGDRIVIEIGAGEQNDLATTGVILRFGDNAASDFALTSALTTDLNPWCEFSADTAGATPNTSSFFNMFGFLLKPSWLWEL
jgi:hypothetical protein